MLAMTPDAATEIRNLIDQPEVPDAGGVRIANDPAAGSLVLTLAPTPGENDQVLDTSGARVFLDPEAAVLLDDKVLDVAPSTDGQLEFAIGEQGQTAP